jgi:hypothetical protein
MAAASVVRMNIMILQLIWFVIAWARGPQVDESTVELALTLFCTPAHPSQFLGTRVPSVRQRTVR